MNHTVKTVLAVLFCVVCVFVSVIAIGAGLSSMDTLKYEVSYNVVPKVIDTSIECLGDTFEGQTEEGRMYYRIVYTLENPSNYGIYEYQLYPYYEGTDADQDYAYVRAIDEKRPFDLYKEGYYYPAGKRGRFSQVLMVDDQCRQIEIKISQKDDQSFIIHL